MKARKRVTKTRKREGQYGLGKAKMPIQKSSARRSVRILNTQVAPPPKTKKAEAQTAPPLAAELAAPTAALLAVQARSTARRGAGCFKSARGALRRRHAALLIRCAHRTGA